MKAARKTNKTRKTRRPVVALCRIKLRTGFSYQGDTYYKYAPKCGITTDGKTIRLADNTLVTPVNL